MVGVQTQVNAKVSNADFQGQQIDSFHPSFLCCIKLNLMNIRYICVFLSHTHSSFVDNDMMRGKVRGIVTEFVAH